MGATVAGGQFRRGGGKSHIIIIAYSFYIFFYKIDQEDLESLHMILSTECSTVTHSMGQLEAWVG